MELLIGLFVAGLIAGLILGWLAMWLKYAGQLCFTPSEWEELMAGISSGKYKVSVERRQKGE